MISRIFVPLYIIAMTLIAVSSVAFGVWIWHIAGVVLYGSNFEAFHYVLSDVQSEGIVYTTQLLLALMILLLFTTNAGWIIGMGVHLIRKERREIHPA